MTCKTFTALTLTTMLAGHAAGEVTFYTVDLSELNNSNVSGNAVMIVDDVANTMQFDLQANGLEPNKDHVMHIHGRFDTDGTTPIDSFSPTLADDTDGDGLIEVLEGLPQYGDILLTLATENTPTGNIVVSKTFDLTDDSLFFSPVTGNDYTSADIFPLNLREIVIHGMTVASGVGAGTPGEADGTGGYKPVLPIASGEIVGEVVPEPTSLALLALGGLLMARRRRA